MPIKTSRLAAICTLFFGAALSLSAYAYTCSQQCFIQYENCLGSGTLPVYKCQQIYQTCLNQCNPGIVG